MQIYFTYAVIKRVLFHDNFDNDSVSIDKNIFGGNDCRIQSCDPVYFANNHPEKKRVRFIWCKKMHAKEHYVI